MYDKWRDPQACTRIYIVLNLPLHFKHKLSIWFDYKWCFIHRVTILVNIFWHNMIVHTTFWTANLMQTANYIAEDEFIIIYGTQLWPSIHQLERTMLWLQQNVLLFCYKWFFRDETWLKLNYKCYGVVFLVNYDH